MSADDQIPRRPPPRLVPTLTEVVGQPSVVTAHAAVEPAVSAQPTQDISPELDQRLDAAVARALQDELPQLEALVRRIAIRAAREALADILTQDKVRTDVGTNP